MNCDRANSLTRPAFSARATPPRDGARRPELWIRTTAGSSEGFGHLRRSLVLARELSAAFKPLFLLDIHDCEARRMVADAGWDTLDYAGGSRLPLHRAPAAVVFDTRRTEGSETVVLGMKRAGIPVASIHDMGLALLPSDLIVDGSIVPLRPESAPPAARCYCGPSYLVLESPGRKGDKSTAVPSRVGRIHVGLGGGDSSAFLPGIVEGLRRIGRPVEVVAQPGFVPSNWASLRGVEKAPLRFRWADPAEESSELLAAADLAITAGGLSAYEALAAGTPLLALAHDRHQHETVVEIERHGACVDLGLGQELVAADLGRRVAELDCNPELRQKMADRGRRLVDGRGAVRVSRLIQALAAAAGAIPGEGGILR